MQLALVKTIVFFREPNPILVRELKQFVRNRLLLYFMLFYLALISLVTVIVLALPDIAKLFPFRFFYGIRSRSFCMR